VVGSDLIIDTSKCDAPPLSFRVVNDAGKAKPATFKELRDEKVILNLPAEAKTGSWTLKVMLGANQAASIKLTDPPSP
jgi:hypothetical protein